MVLISVFILYQPMADKMLARIGNKYVVPEIEHYIKWAFPIGLLAILLSNVLLTKFSQSPGFTRKQ